MTNQDPNDLSTIGGASTSATEGDKKGPRSRFGRPVVLLVGLNCLVLFAIGGVLLVRSQDDPGGGSDREISMSKADEAADSATSSLSTVAEATSTSTSLREAVSTSADSYKSVVPSTTTGR